MNPKLRHMLTSEVFETILVLCFVVVSVALIVAMCVYPSLIGLCIIFVGAAPRLVADTEAALKSARKQRVLKSGCKVYQIVTYRTRLRRVVGG